MKETVYRILRSLPVKLGAFLSWALALVVGAAVSLYPTEIKELLGSSELSLTLLRIAVPVLALTTIYATALWLLKPMAIASETPAKRASTGVRVHGAEHQMGEVTAEVDRGVGVELGGRANKVKSISVKLGDRR